MDLSFLDSFADPSLKKPEGKGALLAGVVLGYIAYRQVRPPKSDSEVSRTAGDNTERLSVDKSPLFKQIEFGRLDLKSLKRLLSRVPQLVAAYRDSLDRSAGNINRLCATAGALILEGQAQDLGVDGNFAFTIGFANAPTYYWLIFGRPKEGGGAQGLESEEDMSAPDDSVLG